MLERILDDDIVAVLLLLSLSLSLSLLLLLLLLDHRTTEPQIKWSSLLTFHSYYLLKQKPFNKNPAYLPIWLAKPLALLHVSSDEFSLAM